MNRQAIIVAALALGAFATVATDAKADPVGNPGEFSFLVPWGQDSLFRFASNDPIELGGNGMGATPHFDVELAGDGEVSSVTSTLATSSFTVSGITPQVHAELQFRPASSGTVNIEGPRLSLDMRARIRFTIMTTPTPTVCSTAEFDLYLDEYDTSPCPASGYNETTGAYCLVNTVAFTVPQLAASACGNEGNDLNSRFGLGTSGGSLTILNGDVSPTITQ